MILIFALMLAARPFHGEINTLMLGLVFAPVLNRPFYSCGSVTRPMSGSKAAGDLVLIETSLLFLCK